jgi:signal transduction histidine kinase/Na+/proline symporter
MITEFQLGHLMGLAGVYIAMLLFIGYTVERGWVSARISQHPLTGLLALGLLFGTWTLFGTLGLAFAYDGGLFFYIFGLVLAFVGLPLVIRPILRITDHYQLRSLADLMAFRFRSRSVGTLVTLTLTILALPIFALQIQTLTTSTQLLVGSTWHWQLALGFVVLAMLITTWMSGAEGNMSRHSHSITFTLAVDTICRLGVILLLAGFVSWQVFRNPLDAIQWQHQNIDQLAALSANLGPAAGATLVGLFFLAPLMMPHTFHLLLRERPQQLGDRWLQWGMPVLILMLSLPMLIIFWGGIRLGFPSLPEYFALSIGLQLSAPWLSLMVYAVIASAALATLVVGTYALSAMWINHGLLPLAPPKRASLDLQRWLMQARRSLAIVILLCGLGFFALLQSYFSLTSLGMLAFVSSLHLLPGLIGILYWQRASKVAFMLSLSTGLLSWLIILGLPLVIEAIRAPAPLPVYFDEFGQTWLTVSWMSLALNALVFVSASYLFPATTAERNAAAACQQDVPLSQSRRGLKPQNAREFIHLLAGPLGQVTAEREVERALKRLGYSLAEYRPFALRNLRDLLEINLSGMMGPSVAHILVERYLAIDTPEVNTPNDGLYVLENRLEGLHNQLTGMARELDQLRRFHRDTLMRLPTGVFLLAHDGEILLWNDAMVRMTGVLTERALGAQLDILPPAWHKLLDEFVTSEHQDISLKPLAEETQQRWLNLHKSVSADLAKTGDPAALVIMVDDQTQLKALEEELVHNERLAAIGSLSAGVAHEIGNPITAIDSLAQELRYLNANPEVAEVAQHIRDQASRVTSIVQSLVSYAHAGQSLRPDLHQPYAIDQIVQEAINLLQLSKDNSAIEWLNQVPEGLLVLCHPQRLGQVFVNLLSNARDASEAGGVVTITAEADVHRVIITVADAGHGIPEHMIDRVLEPFFTTKEVGKGTGLGLSLANNIIEEHYGSLSIQSSGDPDIDRGTRIIITLPRANEDIA